MSVGKADKNVAARLSTLAGALSRAGAAAGKAPLASKLTMKVVYPKYLGYDAARQAMAPTIRDTFDERFQQWLFWVYDPLSAVAAYFGVRQTEAAQRMRRAPARASTSPRSSAMPSLNGANGVTARGIARGSRGCSDSALPEATDAQARFREVPRRSLRR